mmetsp:Transcript_21556/g.38035  ORF Transcript_21556/g.38035 Transcript_21556/m.38035 type:complete len:400 (-) Transcript_21556:89-1288(-)
MHLPWNFHSPYTYQVAVKVLLLLAATALFCIQQFASVAVLLPLMLATPPPSPAPPASPAPSRTQLESIKASDQKVVAAAEKKATMNSKPRADIYVAAATTLANKPPADKYAAIILIGAARTMVWDVVCDNIKTNLIDSLQRHEGGKTTWRVDLLLFLTLQDDPKWPGKDFGGIMRHTDYTADVLDPCISKLQPVYVNLSMPQSFPGKLDCKKKERWEKSHSESDWERMFSQAKRLTVARSYLEDVFEPKARLKYDVVIKTRADLIYLKPVPSLAKLDMNGKRYTSMSTGDWFWLDPRQCSGNWWMSGCQHDKFLTERTRRDGECNHKFIHRQEILPVLTRECSSTSVKHGSSKFGRLTLECNYWATKMQKHGGNDALRKDPGLCKRLQEEWDDAAKPPF